MSDFSAKRWPFVTQAELAATVEAEPTRRPRPSLFANRQAFFGPDGQLTSSALATFTAARWELSTGAIGFYGMRFLRANTALQVGNYGSNTFTDFGRHTISTGEGALAKGDSSFAQGIGSQARGFGSFAQGSSSALADYSHSEGLLAQAEGGASHAEGWTTFSRGDYSHAEGSNTAAEAEASHAEGSYTATQGFASHAEGIRSIARRESQQAYASGGPDFGLFQTSLLVLRGSTPGLSAGESVELKFGAEGNTRFFLEGGKAFAVKVTAICAGLGDGTVLRTIEISFCAWQTADGSTVTIAGSGTPVSYGDEQGEIWTLVSTASSSPPSIVLTFATNDSQAKVNVAAKFEFTEVVLPTD